MTQLPDRMTGKELVEQETHEASMEKNLFDSMDKVDRRDKRLHIVSSSFTRKGLSNYDSIRWRQT